MNITLSASEQVVQRTRQFAVAHGTSLNQLVRDYLERIAGMSELERDAEEFGQLARSRGGRSPVGFTFDRDEIHRR